MPIDHLWDDDGHFGNRIRALTAEEVRAFVREAPCRFVEVNIGSPLRWHSLAECFDCWKRIRSNLALGDEICRDDYPDGFVFFASEWAGRAGERLIVLERHH